MIIITQKNGFISRHKGNIEIVFGAFATVRITANWTDGDWDGNSYDLFFLEDIESINGEDDGYRGEEETPEILLR